MKITYFINQYPHVSHTFVRREIIELEQQGFSVQRIAIRGWQTELVDEVDVSEKEKTQFILRNGIKGLLGSFWGLLKKRPRLVLEALQATIKMSRLSERNVFYHLIYLLEACQLAEWCETEQSQHIHAHFGTNSTQITMLAKILSDIDYSFTVHGPEEFDKPLGLHLKEKIAHSKFVVAISSFGRSQLFRWASLEDWNKVKVVHCGLDNAFLSSEQTLPDFDKKQLLCIGRLCEQKGQLLLLEAFTNVVEQVPEAKLVLAGDGDMRAEVDAFISKNHLHNNVEITGWISSNRVKELLAESNAMILPSFAEGLPVAIMEAMAIQRVVITSHIAGIPELIKNNKTGLSFPAGSVEEIEKAILAFFEMSQDDYITMTKEGYKAVCDRHNIETEARKLGQLIQGTSE